MKGARRHAPGRAAALAVSPLALELTLRWPVDELRPAFERPRVDLLLALPRPLQLKRMLPMIAQVRQPSACLSRANLVFPAGD